MPEEKTYFNDLRPNRNYWRTFCAGCRCDTRILVCNYPHGPQEVKYCPVCGDRLEEMKVERFEARQTEQHATPGGTVFFLPLEGNTP